MSFQATDTKTTMTEPSHDKKTMIGRQSSITIGLLVALFPVLTFIGGIVWAVWSKLEAMEDKLDQNVAKMQLLADDHFGLERASELNMREAMANKGHRVPDPRNPGAFFHVPND